MDLVRSWLATMPADRGLTPRLIASLH